MHEAAELQAIAWQAHETAAAEIHAIMKLLTDGAQIENGPLVYDSELKMVRTRKIG